METVKILNLGLRFLLEVAALIAVSYWGFHVDGTLANWVAGFAAPGFVIFLWARFIAPKAVSGLSETMKMVLGTLILLVTALGLAAAGQSPLATAFAIVIAGNAALIHLLGAPSG